MVTPYTKYNEYSLLKRTVIFFIAYASKALTLKCDNLLSPKVLIKAVYLNTFGNQHIMSVIDDILVIKKWKR